MRIAILSTPFLPVPPPDYGGTELIVAELVRGYLARGHEVTLFTVGESPPIPGCDMRSLYARAVWPPDPYPEVNHVGWAVESLLADPRPFDVLHAHLPAALAFAPLVDVPMVYTVHHEREVRLAPLYKRAPAQLVAISERQRALAPELAAAEVIHHGLDPARYPLGRGDGGYVAFLGRFSEEKGVHHAIRAARTAGLPIKLGGQPHWKDSRYHAGEVAPLLDLPGVQAIGPVGGPAKSQLLGDALALAFPIAWEEPFGLVLIEAMLSGTPVVAFARGSVAEIVDEGVTGYIVADEAALARRLAQLGDGGFDRAACRARASARFSAARMVDDYLHVYRRCAASHMHATPHKVEASEDVRRSDAATTT